MSGITGWVSREHDLTLEKTVIEDMTASLSRRGPDGGGVWVQPGVALGHQLLATEHVAVRQPITAATPAGPLGIVYDGQVYNHLRLREELSRAGHAFHTDDHAETILRGYLEWGDAVAERLNGMYAFAIWDGRSRELILVRDRMGLKPLYFYPLPDGVLFGSEPKAIFANPRAERVIEAGGMCEIFSGFNRTPGNAIWSGMRELYPGSLVTVGPAGSRERAYWRLVAEPHQDDQQTTVATAREMLGECVRMQMPAAGTCCVLLSGGLDSSVIAGLVAEHAREQGRRTQTFTIDFVDQDKYFKAHLVPALPDTPFAHDVAKYARTEHTDLVFDHETVADPAVRQACIDARDLPVGFGDRDLSFYLMSRAVSERCRVALSGDGGGQTFGPYPARRDHEPAGSDPWQPRRIPLDDDALVSAAFLAAIGRDEYVRQHTAEAMRQTPILDGDSETDRRVRASYYLSMTRMPHWATAERRDRVGVNAGLEVRGPYFDHRLIQYLFNAPWPLKAFDGKEKSLLRAVGGELIPVSVRERRKKGYPGILHIGYTAALQQQVGELARSNHAVLEFYDRQQVADATSSDPEAVSRGQQFGMERLLDLAMWADSKRPTFKLSW